MTIRTAIFAALCLAAPPIASAQTPAPEQFSSSAIEQRLAADGFRVLEVERYANTIEVKGFDRAGVCTELHLDPRTGEVLRRERDDDCGARRHHHDDHRRRSRPGHD